jgi:16S rRNA (cytosine967-C5)-methyltransferase
MLSQKDMNLASNLIYTCLRHQSRLDFLIDGKLEAVKSTPQTVRIILRMGLAQLLFFDRVAFHAAVNETAELAKKFAPGREGLVNAVLRGFIRDMEECSGAGAGSYWPKELDGRETPILTRLSTLYSYPDWLVDLLVSRWGLKETRSYLVASNQATPPTLRTNLKLISRDELQKLLPFETLKTGYSPWGLTPKEFSGRVFSWPGYKEGFFSVQDEASQILPLLAGIDGPPRTVLDVCAGLGGKTLGILNAFPEANMLSLDKNPESLKELSLEAKRLRYFDSLRVMAGDVLTIDLLPRFDLVIVDAPCSGLGVIRRRPDLKWRKSPADVYRCVNLQLSILNAASRAVYPGGKLIYGICTIMDEEGPGVIETFLKEKGDYSLCDRIPPELEELRLGEGTLRLLPHRHGTDGFFYAVLERKA